MSKITRKEFISKLAPYAIKDMEKTGVPASLTIAQGILESADGNSTLTKKANNLFGIKGKGTKGSIALPTTEYIEGKPDKVLAEFRAYSNWGESVSDHSNLFLNGVSWDKNIYKGVIGKDGITAAYEVARAGYATDPKYADKLIKLMFENDLFQYDKKEDKKEMDNSKIDELESKIKSLESKLIEYPAPDWLLKEFPDALTYLNRKTGTLDFWRSFATSLRILNKIESFK